MKLTKQKSETSNIEVLNAMIVAMRRLLNDPDDPELSFKDILTFQDDDGSFKLFDSYNVPNDARVDFCHTPTYIGAAILMRALLSGKNDLIDALKHTLDASLHRGLNGHGYEFEDGRLDAMNIFIKGGLCAFMETHHALCPEFHMLVHNILHEYKTGIICGDTKRGFGVDYREQWQDILNLLPTKKRFYIAYGSNMDKRQMLSRCHNPTFICSTYIDNWQLTIPSYANIEPLQGIRTPALVWEICATDELKLDQYEGYPKFYDKIDIVIDVKGQRISAMAYVMTGKYKKDSTIKVRDGYEEQITAAYQASGFSKDEYKPYRGQSY